MPAQSLDPRRDAFARADYAGRCRLVEEALATAAPDDDLIFDWLDDLAADAATPADHAQFAALCAQLRTAAPDVYAEVAGDLLAWRIAHALLDGRFADLPPLTAELAPLAADFPEAVVASADRLAYAGQLPLLADLLRRAWPHLQMGDFEEWEVEQFAVQAMNYAILDFVARTDAADAADPALLTLLDEFAEIDAAALAEHLAQITGQATRTWQPADFDVPAQAAAQGEVPDAVDASLTQLLREFIHYATAAAGLPLSRVALAYWPLNEYLLGRLVDAGRSYQPRRQPKGRYRRRAAGLSPLCPTTRSLAQFLADMLELDTPQHYPAAALMAVLPTWLRFLADRGLILPEQQAYAAGELRALLPELRTFWTELDIDPALAASLTAWEA